MGLIAIGDIHGCCETLDALLEELAPGKDDKLIFVGDYVDRGPCSRAVIDRLIGLRDELDCVFLRGNHEQLMLAYVDYGEYDAWAMNGGVMTLNSYLDSNRQLAVPMNHIDFIRETTLYYDTPDYFFVHAGADPRLTIAENIESADEDVFLWERSHLRARTLAWEKTVVCGHTPVEEPINDELLINIDTGCVYFMHPGRGALTAVRLPEREFVSMPYSD